MASWGKMAGCTLAWIFNCYFEAGAEGKPHLEYKLRNIIMMTENMKASDPFEISIQLEKIRKMKLELEAENLTAGQIIEAIYKHPVIYQLKHKCLRVMQDEAKKKIMSSDKLLSKAANKVATKMAEEKVEQERIDLTISMITQNSATSAAGVGTGGRTHIPLVRWDQLGDQERHERRARVESDTRIKFNLLSNACLKCGKIHSMDTNGFCPNLGKGCTYCDNVRHTINACFRKFNAK